MREELLPAPLIAPWEDITNVDFIPSLPTPISKEDPPDKKKQATLDHLATLPPADLEMWTDGSCRDGFEFGGAGAIIKPVTINLPEDTELELRAGGGRYCSSYRTEMVAIRLGLRWAEDHLTLLPQGAEIRILSDSQSSIRCLEGGPSRQTYKIACEIWRILKDISSGGRTHITFQWVPGHCDLRGNEEADSAAKNAQILCHEAPIDLSTAEAIISRNAQHYYRTQLKEHAAVNIMKRSPPNLDKEANLTKYERRVVSQLRTGGECLILRKYLHKIGQAPSPTCERCNENDDTLDHMLLYCPATWLSRSTILGPDPTLVLLSTNPEMCVNFLRSTGRLAQ